MSLVTTSGGYMRELLAQSVETITASVAVSLSPPKTHNYTQTKP